MTNNSSIVLPHWEEQGVASGSQSIWDTLFKSWGWREEEAAAGYTICFYNLCIIDLQHAELATES